MITRHLIGSWISGFALACSSFLSLHAAPIPGQPNLLWYDQPATKWVQALPVGNGRLGAMIFGQPGSERLQLNDVTIWSGGPQPDADRKDAYKVLPELRQLLRDGKYVEAQQIANTRFNSSAPYNASYQMLGDLNFEFALPPGVVTNYSRWLDIDSAIAGVEFTVAGTTYRREIFSSAPDHVLVQRLTCTARGGLNFTMKLSRPTSAKTRVEGNALLVMTGNTDMPRLNGNLDYEVRAQIVLRGGTVSRAGDILKVQGANEALVLLACGTTFVLDHDKGYRGADPKEAERALQAAAKKSFSRLKSAHVADYQKYFHRVRLDLGTSAAASLPTDIRLRNYADGKSDPSFAALFFQFGRYLMISSSRSDNPLPANLQGIWADGLNPPWNSDYHANINLQMIYWPAEPANLGEMHLPLIRFTTNLVASGARTAKAYFGPDTPGWVAGYTANGWSWTSPGQRLPWGIWFGGSGWLCRHLWEHYAYTQDKAYLRKVYPVLRGASEFWLANLVEGADGRLIVSPSSSPENNFTTDSGVTADITEGATMDQSIVWDLLDKTAHAAAALAVDKEFQKRLEAARDRIRPLQIGKAGQLMEWNGDWDLNSREPHHRHVSHLYALYPSDQISVQTMPRLADAAKKSLELRGDEGTGWSIAWKENLWARLRDGDHALRLLSHQLRSTEQTGVVMADAGGTYPNLFDAHPPFQIDGNFGAVSGIAEMLLQSHERYTDTNSPAGGRYIIDLLPALPTAWAAGSVTGLRARGGFAVDIQWRNGTLVEAVVRSMTGGAARLRYGSITRDINLRKGRSVKWNGR